MLFVVLYPTLNKIYLILSYLILKYLCWLMSPWGTRKWTSAIGTWQFTVAFSLPNILIKPDAVTLVYGDCPLSTPLPYDSGTPKYLCGFTSPWGTRKWTSAIGTRQFTMAFSLPNIVSKPELVTLLLRDFPPVYSLGLRLRNTKVPVWTHKSMGYPKMDISHWDAAIHYGVQLAQYCDQTRSCNATFPRFPPVYSLALRLRNTKVPVWAHESMGYPKMDISHWDAAIHYGVPES